MKKITSTKLGLNKQTVTNLSKVQGGKVQRPFTYGQATCAFTCGPYTTCAITIGPTCNC